ncbi:MAG: PucR family transcriptional regulator ligand-binding domain-containing protein [Bacillota bacterium]|nr:PucR family transcriptional regulator ligand-binding domain-containing protein [Bacillota bacterium]
MAVKVRDILNFGGLLGSTVIAGEGGLDTNVESVSVLEIADSSIARWVEPNQLYITSFYAIWDDVAQQKVVIRNLKDSGCCGLVLCNVGLLMQTVDREVLEYCDERNFPLIRARANVSYIDIMSPIMNVLFTDDSSSMQRIPYDGSEPLQNVFYNMIINGDSQDKVLREMNHSMGAKISYYDTFGKLLFSDEPPEEVKRETEYLRLQYNHVLYSCREKGYTVLDCDGRQKLFVQIRSHQNMFGIMITDYDSSFEGDFIDTLMNTLIMPCALIFGREDRIIDYQKRSRAEFITDLITGNFTTDANDLRRAGDIGLDIQGVDHLMIININTFHRTGNDDLTRDLRSYISRNLMPQVEQILSKECPGSWSEYRSDVTILFLNMQQSLTDLDRLAHKFLDMFHNNKLELSVSIGISNEAGDFHELPNAYNQAYNAAIMGRNYYGTERIISYDQIWFLSQLHKMRETDEGVRICREMLRPLLKYDEEHGTELVKTAYVLLHNSCNVKEAAEQLYVHKNTMLQRKNKIIEILGYSPYEMPHSLNFLMAFEIMGYGEDL